MGNEWKAVRLTYFCLKIGSGATPKGGSGVYLEDGNIYLIRSQNIYNDSFNPSGLVFITEDAAVKLKNVVVEKNDILLNITGDSVARVCLAPEEFLPARVNQHVLIIRPNPKEFDARFIRYFLASPYQQQILLNLASSGATRNALTKGMIENFEVPKAPLKIQCVISDQLETLDNKIQLNRQTNQTLEQMAQALFKSWFVDFDPVIDNALAAGNPIPDPLKKRAAKRAEARKKQLAKTDHVALPKEQRELFPSEFEETEALGWVPKGWGVNAVGDVIENVGGGTPKTKEDSYWVGGTHPFCTPKDMSSLASKVLLGTERKLTDSGVAKVSSGVLPEGVVLMSSRAPIGYLAISKTPVTVNQGIIVMKPSDKYGSEFLLSWAEENMEEIISRANGSTFLEISKKNFRDIPFLEPSDLVCSNYSNIAGDYFKKITLLQKRN